MWNRTWQMACRVEEIPNVGDHIIYEVIDYSLIVVRSSGTEIKAFHNVCLHRGRILRETGGHVANFRCKFHGFAWRLDGKLSSVPCRWDFPDLRDEEMTLPEAKVGLWGGFVFINLDPNAIPLAEYLSDVPVHFAGWEFENRYIAAHVGIVVKANWKVALEAGLETMHVVATHPQALPYMADTNTQYDVRKDRPHYTPPYPCSSRSRSKIRFAVWCCLAGWDLSSSKIRSMIPTNGSSLGRAGGWLRR